MSQNFKENKQKIQEKKDQIVSDEAIAAKDKQNMLDIFGNRLLEYTELNGIYAGNNNDGEIVAKIEDFDFGMLNKGSVDSGQFKFRLDFYSSEDVRWPNSLLSLKVDLSDFSVVGINDQYERHTKEFLRISRGESKLVTETLERDSKIRKTAAQIIELLQDENFRKNVFVPILTELKKRSLNLFNIHIEKDRINHEYKYFNDTERKATLSEMRNSDVALNPFKIGKIKSQIDRLTDESKNKSKIKRR